MLLKEYSSTKSSFHTNVLQIVFKIDFALPLLFPRDFPRDSTFLPFLPISIPPNLHHYLSLRTSRVPSFLHFQAQYAPAPSLPLHAGRLHVARGLTSHLILGFGFGKVSFFQNHILYHRMHQPPQTPRVSTAGWSPHILHTKPTVSIHQPPQTVRLAMDRLYPHTG